MGKYVQSLQGHIGTEQVVKRTVPPGCRVCSSDHVETRGP